MQTNFFLCIFKYEIKILKFNHMDTTNFKNMRVGENKWGWEKWMRVGENEWEREKEWEKNEREMNGTIQYNTPSFWV